MTGRDALRRLHHLFERSAVPIEKRSNNERASGFWLVETPSEIRKLLEVKGAQLLVAVDKDQRLLGAYIYHIGTVGKAGKVSFQGFPSSEKQMIKAVMEAPGSDIPKGSRLGIGYMVVVDKEARALHEQDSTAPTSRDIVCAFHAAMIPEFRRHKVPWIVGYVRTSPVPNSARNAHAEMGWREIPGCTTSYQYEISPLQVCSVENSVLVLDVNSKLQDEIIARARKIQGITFIDLDRT